MAVIKNDFPILEYDTSKKAIIEPNRNGKNNFPEYCVMTFFNEVLDNYLKKNKYNIIGEYRSEMKKFPVYEVNFNGINICIIQAVVGSASIAMMTDFLIGGGVKNIITCGVCGVLCDIPAGDIIIPIKALRDEGASYHYLPPTRDVSLNKNVIHSIKIILKKYGIKYIECKTWTTDAFYRETKDMVKYRIEEGCKVVEMECATIASIAKFRKIKFGQLLYSGDILLHNKEYEEREWFNDLNSREKVFFLSLESIVEFYKNNAKKK
jgi:uridine phosphorylase